MAGRDVVGAEELGRLLGVTSRSVRNWHRAGLLPAPLITSPLRWTRSAVERWLPLGLEMVAVRMAEPRVAGRFARKKAAN